MTGVSGSGKSTLINEILFKSLAKIINRSKEKPGQHDSIEGAELIDKVVDIDQSPIGARHVPTLRHTQRSSRIYVTCLLQLRMQR